MSYEYAVYSMLAQGRKSQVRSTLISNRSCVYVRRNFTLYKRCSLSLRSKHFYQRTSVDDCTAELGRIRSLLADLAAAAASIEEGTRGLTSQPQTLEG